jgi:hypothetical protein
MHDRVALATVDGHRIEGRPGIKYCQDAREFALLITPDEGAPVTASLSKVQSAQPIVAPEPLWVVESVAHYLRQPTAIPNGRRWMSAIADEHHYVSVAVALLRKPCMTLQR